MLQRAEPEKPAVGRKNGFFQKKSDFYAAQANSEFTHLNFNQLIFMERNLHCTKPVI